MFPGDPCSSNYCKGSSARGELGALSPVPLSGATPGPPWELSRIMLVLWPGTQVLDHSGEDRVRLGQLSSRPDGRRLWWDTCSHS